MTNEKDDLANKMAALGKAVAEKQRNKPSVNAGEENRRTSPEGPKNEAESKKIVEAVTPGNAPKTIADWEKENERPYAPIPRRGKGVDDHTMGQLMELSSNSMTPEEMEKTMQDLDRVARGAKASTTSQQPPRPQNGPPPLPPKPPITPPPPPVQQPTQKEIEAQYNSQEQKDDIARKLAAAAELRAKNGAELEQNRAAADAMVKNLQKKSSMLSALGDVAGNLFNKNKSNDKGGFSR